MKNLIYVLVLFVFVACQSSNDTTTEAVSEKAFEKHNAAFEAFQNKEHDFQHLAIGEGF